MHFEALGINHNTAPLDLRERLALREDTLGAHLQRLRETARCDEAAILSTCNRVEIYTLTRAQALGHDLLLDFMNSLHPSVGKDDLRRATYHLHDAACVQHLFQVAAGLDSMVLGETEIAGQIKKAFDTAQAAGATGKAMNTLFQDALSTGKKIRTQTRVSDAPLSVASVAVAFASGIFYNFSDKTVLLIGAGETAELTLRHLVGRGVSSVLLANRSRDKALALAANCGGRAIEWEQLRDYLHQADIVISASAAPGYIVNPPEVRRALELRRRAPIFFIDLAVPRDINPEINQLSDTFVYDLDDLGKVIDQNLERRREEARRAQPIVDECVAQFFRSVQQWDVEPAIKDLHAAADAAREAELQRALGRLGALPPEAHEEVRQLTHRLTQKLLHPQVTLLKEASRNGFGYQLAALVKRAFAKQSTAPDSTHDNPPDAR